KATTSSFMGLVLLIHHPTSDARPPNFTYPQKEHHPCPLKPQRLQLPQAQLRTFSTTKNVPCPQCPIVSPCCIIKRPMREQETAFRTSPLRIHALIQRYK